MARLKALPPEAIGIFTYQTIRCSLVFLPHLKPGQKSIKYLSLAEAICVGLALWLSDWHYLPALLERLNDLW